MNVKEFNLKKVLKYFLLFLILSVSASICLNCTNKINNSTKVQPLPNTPVVDQSSKTETEKPATQSLKDHIKNLHKPVIVDFGSTGCIPCKMMEPILEDLNLNYSDKFETIFINVSKDIKATREFGINVIPTQIFFDEKGEEFYRHIGFFSKEEILNIFKSHGISID